MRLLELMFSTGELSNELRIVYDYFIWYFIKLKVV